MFTILLFATLGCSSDKAQVDDTTADDTSADDSSVTTPTCPPEACAAGSECLETADPGSATAFTLRASQVNFTQPSVFTTGLMRGIFESAIWPDLPECGLDGTASWNLLLSFDLAANTLQLASAQPIASAQGPWTPLNATVEGLPVAPVSASATPDAGGAFSASPGDANLAIFLDQSGSGAIVLPLSHVSVSGVLSASHACIGHYNTETLVLPECLSDVSNLAFTDGGTLTASILLEDADASIVTSLNQSLCVLLSGDATTYGDGGRPTRCKRDQNGQIYFAGDWCDATNAPADANCFDAVQMTLGFAASAVDVAQ